MKGQVRTLEVNILQGGKMSTTKSIDWNFNCHISTMLRQKELKSKFKIKIETLNGNHPTVNYEQPGFKWTPPCNAHSDRKSASNVLDTWKRPSFM